MEPIRWTLPNLQLVLHSPSYFNASHILTKGNTFTCSLNPILPGLYLDLAVSITFLFFWVPSTCHALWLHTSSAEIYTNLLKKRKTFFISTSLFRNHFFCLTLHSLASSESSLFALFTFPPPCFSLTHSQNSWFTER